MWFLGMDVGTSGTRAVLVDEQGSIVSSASEEHAPFRTPHPGWAEQDPEDWWRAALIAIRAAIAAAPAPHQPIASVGLTGQMHGAVLLDKDGAVLRPSLIWCDTRTQPQCDWLTKEIGYDRLIELTCNPALPNFTLTKLLWVKTHEPEIFARTAHILCPKDYVRFRLTGTYAIDVQEASGTLLLDVTNRRWSSEVAAAAGIPKSWLPEVFESPEVCAKISSEAASLTGLASGTPVVAGAGDQGAGAVGMGILQPGSVSATIGTSGVVFAATAAPIKDPRGRLHTFCHAVPGRWHVMGVTQSAGLSFRWLKETFFAGENYDALTGSASKVAPGSDGLEWAPYLLGERTPHLDPAVRAAFTGITSTHSVSSLRPRVLEGVAYSLQRHLHSLRRSRHPRNRHPSRRRRRARPALAADSSRSLRPSRRNPHRRRRRSLRRRAHGWRRRRTLARSGCCLRRRHQRRRTHRARCGMAHSLRIWLRTLAQALSSPCHPSLNAIRSRLLFSGQSALGHDIHGDFFLHLDERDARVLDAPLHVRNRELRGRRR